MKDEAKLAKECMAMLSASLKAYRNRKGSQLSQLMEDVEDAIDIWDARNDETVPFMAPEPSTPASPP